MNDPEIFKIIESTTKIIMKYYKKNYNIFQKKDDSLATIADLEANNHIFENLKKLTPNYPVIAEENDPKDNVILHQMDYFWLVDPIDGTDGFIRCDDNFTINIALIKNRYPIFGIIYAPATDELYFTKDKKSFKGKLHSNFFQIHCRSFDSNKVDALVSSGNDKGIELIQDEYHLNSITKMGSSMKLAKIAEGKADIYPRFGRTMEWDIAAGHAILLNAGGNIYLPNKENFLYGKDNFENSSFIASGRYCNNL